MSHLKQRSQNNCLNCNATLQGRYCSNCGQENLEPQESLGYMLSHFFNDITHFDGKFFSSLKYLIFKPGFLTKEYVVGRRAAYLNPIRMYLFTSFIFFFIFFSFISEAPVKITQGPKKATAAPSSDTVKKKAATVALQDTVHTKAPVKTLPVTKRRSQKKGYFTEAERQEYATYLYRDRKQYDSLLDAGKVKENWFQRKMNDKSVSLQKRYGKDPNRISEVLQENFKHNVPQIFFLSLPLLALVLKLLYIRRKQFYYVAHVIFTIHLLCFLYISTLIMYAFDKWRDLQYLQWLFVPEMIILSGSFWYLYKAMRNFYGQGIGKTILKYLLFLISALVIVLIATLIILFYSVYKT